MLEKIGKYRIDGVLGSGAMGVVYKAFDMNIARVVALKTIRTELFGDHEQGDLYARFKNEAQASGRLSHPSIVAIYDFGEFDNIAYLAMEFVKATPLNSLLVAGVPTDLDASISCLSQLLRALSYAHARGVVHRDIKPANLLITDDALLKITDFGIARIESSTLTQTGSVIGTPSYMAPEQFRGEAADGRTDVFAAGIVLYQLLTGARPFTGSASTVMHQIMNETPLDPSARNPQVGSEFDAVVQNALAKRPEQRYPSALAFLDALQEAHQAFKQRQGEHASGEDDSERTIHAFRGAPAAGAGYHEPVIPTMANSTNTVSLNTSTPWKQDVLPDLQTLLSLQVGPVAKLLIKNAAADVTNMDDLCDRLLPHIPSDQGRAHFLSGFAVLRQKLAGTSATNSGLATRTGLTAHGTSLTTSPSQRGALTTGGTQLALTEALLTAAEAALTPSLGPIARVLVKRTAKQTANRQEFIGLLAAHLTSEEERAAFMRKMQK